ncbi:hypothetical protein L600_002200000340 [Isoptericola variabilis J7]|uniref:Uncharacterized protein n=1 Tax=Isoptericola variabilis (strain 225) TaxID=743718 RepID=F6FQ30_ISOV2|nr:hypothetical protein Isova_2107 [Isoptericola variabilis 225]TWH31642.1 hypothetical protein L600_002200000340 [Isoptericola variabilis J7]
MPYVTFSAGGDTRGVPYLRRVGERAGAVGVKVW